MDIAAWLRGLGLERYQSAFQANHIDAEVLRTLTDAHLRELGVASLGHRRKLLAAIAALGQGQATRPADAGNEDITAPARPAAALPSVQAERRQLTIMFVDMVGSTALSERLDPEDMRELLAAYQHAVASEVVLWQGHVGRFMGDGVLAYFGWPRAHEDEAERAVRSGLAIVERVHGIKGPQGINLSARVGIATGLVVVGDLIGEEPVLEEDVIGATPNLAARLQQLAPPGGVVIAESTRYLLGGVFALVDLGPQAVKGIEGPVRAFQVLGEGTAESRFEARHSAQLGPLIGRRHELALLLDRWEAARNGEGQVVVLAGEPGIGKSRIVLALRERLRGEPRIRLSYGCSPHHVNSVFWPVRAQLERAAGILREDQLALKLEKLAGLLEQAGRPVEHALPSIAELLGLQSHGHNGAPSLTPHERKRLLFAALLAQIEGLARRQPLLMLLEDGQWLDPSSREFFDAIVDRIQRLPVLLVVTFRPVRAPPWTKLPYVTLLTLNRLARAQAAELIAQVAGGLRLPQSVIDTILARAEGVPLFIEELTKAVIEPGSVKPASNGAEPVELRPASAVPATLQDSLLARLDRLPPAKEMAQVAACIGREFDRGLIAAVSGLPKGNVDRALDQLVGAELVFKHEVPGNGFYSFKHALVRDVAYASLLKSRRQHLHIRIAKTIERTQPEMTVNQPEILAHHLVEGGLPCDAAGYLLAAGRLAKARHAVREAASHLETCLRFIAKAGSAARQGLRGIERDCLLLLGDLASLADDLTRANDYYNRGLALADTEADRSLARNKYHHLRYAFRDRVRIAFYEHGRGAPSIVFVNPIVYGLAIFQPILERLCQEFRVITIDCRGTGRSDPLVRPYLLRHHMEDLLAAVEQAEAAPFVGVGIPGAPICSSVSPTHTRGSSRS